MKNSYIFTLIILLAASNLMAQNFGYTPNKDTTATITNDQYEIYDIFISTTVPEAITYQFYLVSNTFPGTWGTSLCDYTNCHIGIPTGVKTMTPITLVEAQNGVQGFLKLTVNVLNNYGSGTVKIYVYDSNDINRGDTVSWTITHVQPSTINDIDDNFSLSFYPNPAKSNVNFNNDTDENMTVEIYNALGKLVNTNLIFAHEYLKLDVTKFNAGVYFVSFPNNNGDRKTKKLIIQ